MVMGFRGNNAWRDMSEFLVHFTKDSQYENALNILFKIIGSRSILSGNRFGIAKSLSESIAPRQNSVCLSEIPLDHLDRLVSRRETKYGIGFRREFIIGAGGARVWYVDLETQLQERIRMLMRDDREAQAYAPPTSPIWDLTPFIDVSGNYGGRPYRFEWEREWRVRGDVKFSESDVAFLTLPEEDHARARTFFQGVLEDGSGPAYMCPFIDPLWPAERIELAMTR